MVNLTNSIDDNSRTAPKGNGTRPSKAIWEWRPTWFKVVVNNGRSDLIEVLQGVDNLHDDGAALLL